MSSQHFFLNISKVFSQNLKYLLRASATAVIQFCDLIKNRYNKRTMENLYGMATVQSWEIELRNSV